MAAAQCLCQEGYRVDLDCEQCVNKAVADATCNNAGCPNYDMSLEDLLVEAAKDGKTKVMETLLKACVNINCVDSLEGHTPLTAASAENQIEAVKLLINWATHVDQSNARVCSADLSKLYNRECSAPGSQSDDTKCSLSINKPDVSGVTALWIAASYNYREIVQILVEAGADVHCKGTMYEQPIHYAAQEGDTGMVQTLVKAGADPNCKDEDGNQPIHLAAQEGHMEMIEMLVEAGANVDCKDDKGWQPIHCAACSGRTGIIELLLQAGVSVNTEDSAKETPLILAATGGHTQTVQFLLGKGAGVEMVNNRGESALDMAIDRSSSSTEQMAFLYAAGASICPRVLNRYRNTIPQFIIDDQKPLLSLLGLCRRKIRAILLSPAWGNQKYLNSIVVAQLPVPQLLKEILLFGVDI